MNYRHAFHAGNFADVFKHVVLGRILAHLREKPAPFRVIDTHAGDGLYDLAGEEADRTGEWREGIGRLAGASSAAGRARAHRALPRGAARLQSRASGCATIRARRCSSAACCGRRIASSPASSSRVAALALSRRLRRHPRR